MSYSKIHRLRERRDSMPRVYTGGEVTPQKHSRIKKREIIRPADDDRIQPVKKFFDFTGLSFCRSYLIANYIPCFQGAHPSFR